MPTSTYIPLATITLASTDSSIDFANIPTTGYRDLVLVARPLMTVAGSEARITINGDTGTNYPNIYVGGSGSSTFAVPATGNAYYDANQMDTTAIGVYHFLDYSATDKHKVILHRTTRPGNYTLMQVTRWTNTAAITTLKIYPSGGTFDVGSIWSLYGIAS